MNAPSGHVFRFEGTPPDLAGQVPPDRAGSEPVRWPVHSTHGSGALALARLERGDLEGAIEAIERIAHAPIPDPPRL